MRKLILLTVIGLAGCSSTPSKQTSEHQEDVVISRIDNLKERPDWVSESEPFKITNGKVLSLGQTTIPGDNRVEAAFRISENNGKALVSSAIEQKLDFVLQNAEEGTSVDSTQTRFIGAEASQVVTSHLKVSKRYWEKVATTSDNGERVTRYRVFSLVEMPEDKFKIAVLDAARKRQGKGGISADFAKKVDAHWDSFVQGTVSTEKAAAEAQKQE